MTCFFLKCMVNNSITISLVGVTLGFLNFVQIQYADFDSNFYEEHSDIAALSKGQVDSLRNKLGIKVC